MSLEHTEKKRAGKQKSISQKPRVKILRSIDQSSADLLSRLTTEANKKTFGRRVKESEIIAVGLKLIKEADLLRIRNSTITHKDRIDFAFKDAKKTNHKLGYDEFLGMLLSGEIKVANSHLDGSRLPGDKVEDEIT